jgi:hypothetical protein
MDTLATRDHGKAFLPMTGMGRLLSSMAAILHLFDSFTELLWK